MKRRLAIASVIMAASLGMFAADVTAATRAPSERSKFRAPAARPGENVVEGTIAFTNKDSTAVVLENGMELAIPSSVDVMHSKLLPRRPVKIYYVKDDTGHNVATAVELRGVHPGEVG